MNTTEHLKLVKARLEKLEVEKGVKVLYAAVVGSRAYGLDSPTSDCDTHFVFVYPAERYLNLTQPADYLDCGDDVNGHELRHFLGILLKSGFNALELLNSPLCVMGEENREELLSLATQFLNRGKLVAAYGGCVYRELGRFNRYTKDDDAVGLTKASLSAFRLFASGYLFYNNPQEGYLVPTVFNELVDAFLKTTNGDERLTKLAVLAQSVAQHKRKGVAADMSASSELLLNVTELTDNLLELNKKNPTYAEKDSAPLNNYFRKNLGL